MTLDTIDTGKGLVIKTQLITVRRQDYTGHYPYAGRIPALGITGYGDTEVAASLKACHVLNSWVGGVRKWFGNKRLMELMDIAMEQGGISWYILRPWEDTSEDTSV